MSRRPGMGGRAGDRRFLAAAGIAALLLVVSIYAATVRDLPFGSAFEVRGVFATANQLRSGNPVRRAGVDIGKVTKVEAGPANTSIVTMELSDHAHLHSNASLAIKPRLFFEGSFYVDVTAGSPAAPVLRGRATIPLESTSGPVQVDQVLSTLTEPVRDALTGTMDQLASGLGGPPRAHGSDELRRATRELDAALVSVQATARAVQGTQAGDLHRAVGSAADFTQQLAADPEALAGAVSSFNRVAAALSSDPDSLSASVRSINDVLRSAPASLRELDAALPVVTRFAQDLRPALRKAPPALNETTALLRQVELAMGARELPSLVRDLEPLTANLPALEPQLARALKLLDAAAQCMNRTVLPALDTKIPDGPNSTFRPVWHDILHLGANLLGSSAGFDGNGGTLRLGLAEGANALQEHIPGIGELVGSGEYEGVNPVWLGAGVQPEYRPDAWCKDQKVPNYGARSRLGTPTNKRVVRARRPSASELRRRSAMLALFTGGPADRRKLLRMLLRELPSTRADAHPPRRPARRRPARRPALPSVPRPGAGRPAPSTGKAVEEIVGGLIGAAGDGRGTPPGLGKTVEGILNGILGRGKGT